MRAALSALGRLVARCLASYVVGIALAASIVSLAGGSTMLLITYSLIVGAPFFLAALLIAAAFHRNVAAHPGAWAIAAPIATGLLWRGFRMSMGELFSAERLTLYAIFCAAACGAVFFASTLRWPLR